MTDTPRYVSWDRWDATQQDTERRLNDNEQRLEELRGAEEVHASMQDRISALEQAGRQDEAGEASRRERLWVILIGIITGVVCPLIVTTIITWLHLKSLH